MGGAIPAALGTASLLLVGVIAVGVALGTVLIGNPARLLTRAGDGGRELLELYTRMTQDHRRMVLEYAHRLARQICPACGATTRAGARFCSCCGWELERAA
ncbi:MAG: hypothetical protein DRI79_12915 [Chloroflexi bacterium]|nr:MAG: hypothetical protein DRI79_12915 [Chloroflexota bacterium]